MKDPWSTCSPSCTTPRIPHMVSDSRCDCHSRSGAAVLESLEPCTDDRGRENEPIRRRRRSPAEARNARGGTFPEEGALVGAKPRGKRRVEPALRPLRQIGWPNLAVPVAQAQLAVAIPPLAP